LKRTNYQFNLFNKLIKWLIGQMVEKLNH
jgi:hypothetical protein